MPRRPLVRAIDWSSGRPLNGRYKLISKLGEGGMGAVWLCEDLLLRRKVALKTLFADRAELAEEDLERFRREVAIAHAINHPNVARTYDLGEAAGVHYLTMEHLEGETLVARIKRSDPLSSTEVRAIAVNICQGLRAAHKAGVVHRDLKPANIMLVPDARVAVIMDFGIAAAVDDDEPNPEELVEVSANAPWEVTSAGRGTPTYMAPEQWDGQRGDARTDLYALGVILYVSLTKKVPFKAATNQELADLHRSSPAPNLETLVPGVDRDLAKLVAACLAKRPEQRPQSVGDVLERLDRGQRRKQAIAQVAGATTILAILLSLVGVGLWTIAHSAVIREMRPAQARLAEAIANQIAADDLDRIGASKSITSPEFLRVHRLLERYHQRDPEIKSLYVMKPATAAGHFTFVVDLYPKDVDRDGNGVIEDEEKGSLPGDDYAGEASGQIVEGSKAAIPMADTDFTRDSWGLSLSGYAPVLRDGKTTGYFVGADEGNSHLEHFQIRLLVILLVTWLALSVTFAVLRQRFAAAKSSQ
jgi:serine/threonine protein kinase